MKCSPLLLVASGILVVCSPVTPRAIAQNPPQAVPQPAPATKAAAPAIPPDDVRRILEELKKLETQAKAANALILDRRTKALAQGAADAAYAVELYEQAERAVQFAGAKDETAQFNAWKKKNANLLKDKAFREGARAHIEYLILSLKAARIEKIDLLIPKVQGFADAVLAHPEWAEDKASLLNTGINASVFTKWLNLDAMLPKDGWHPVGAEADEIYTTTILPVWRRLKNPAIIRYWDYRIEREDLAAQALLRDEARENFLKRQRPKLLWNRATDLVVLGRTADAANAMIAVLRSSTEHPQFSAWSAELMTLLGATATP
jgi:hypothetical protein